jgi:hypothetical protein
MITKIKALKNVSELTKLVQEFKVSVAMHSVCQTCKIYRAIESLSVFWDNFLGIKCRAKSKELETRMHSIEITFWIEDTPHK